MVVVDEVPGPWFIDAWDSLAGRAFLCRRWPDGADDPQLDHPAVFVAPPFFQPEPVASRARGLAATRGTFQAGLFVNDSEVDFPTLDDAIAFIRRGYNSHGPGPLPGAPVTRRGGPEDRGGPGLALKPLDLPHTPGFRQLDDAIGEVLRKFVKAVGNIERLPRRMEWTLADPAAVHHASEMLVFAGQALMIEMLERFPTRGTIEDFLAWSGPARSLGLQLARLGLWRTVKHAVADMFKLPVEELAKIFALGLPDHFKHDQDYVHPWRILEILFLDRLWEFWDLQRLDAAALYGELGLFPLPQSMADRYRIGGRLGQKDPSVLTLLSRWFGHPAGIKDVTALDRALLMFGGACVVVGPLLRESPIN